MGKSDAGCRWHSGHEHSGIEAVVSGPGISRQGEWWIRIEGDKTDVSQNWSDRPFLESVQSWYWGHGRLGPYSIVWFSYLALNDPTNTTYVSSYVARDGHVLISSCDSSILTVRPFGTSETTSDRYPPRAGDIPGGFKLGFDLGVSNGWLIVNVSVDTLVAGDGEYYMRWTGKMTGEALQVQSEKRQDACPATPSETRSVIGDSGLTGVAVFEQFVLLE